MLLLLVIVLRLVVLLFILLGVDDRAAGRMNLAVARVQSAIIIRFNLIICMLTVTKGPVLNIM